MSIPRTPFVHQGLYEDYGNRFGWRSQWLWQSTTANIWATAIGILVTIAAARLVQIITRIIERWKGQKIEDRTLENIAWTSVLNAWKDVRPGPIQVGTSASNTTRRSRIFQVNWLDFFGQIAVAAIFFMTYAATLAAGVVTSYLITSGTALSQHPDCGLYVANWSFDPEQQLNISRPYESAAQIESASWATTYFDENISRIPGSLIVPGSITIQKTNTTCPFPDYMCYGGDVQPIELTTGPVSASAIGVHAPKTFEFQRTSVCSPLNMNSTYIRPLSQDGNNWTFGYYYGATENDDATYQSIRHAEIGDIPIYQVDTFKLDNFNILTTTWMPIPELMPKSGSTVSIIFIVSQKIFYSEPSIDPIFPAQGSTTIAGRTFWINLSGPGTVLACMEKTEWRDPTTINPAWVPYTDLPPGSDVSDTHVSGGVSLLQNSLVGSDMSIALSYRLGSALNAQSRISEFVSLPLAPEQWKVEVEELFKASVARILINVRDIARGARARYRGYTKVPDPEGLCHDTYKLSTDGWSSVAAGWSLWILALAFLVVILAIPVPDDELFWEILPSVLLVLGNLIWRKILKPFSENVVQGIRASVDLLKKLLR